MTNLRMELSEMGFEIPNDDILKKKILNIKDWSGMKQTKLKNL